MIRSTGEKRFVSANYRITLPTATCQTMGIREGDYVEILQCDEGLYLKLNKSNAIPATEMNKDMLAIEYSNKVPSYTKLPAVKDEPKKTSLSYVYELQRAGVNFDWVDNIRKNQGEIAAKACINSFVRGYFKDISARMAGRITNMLI